MATAAIALSVVTMAPATATDPSAHTRRPALQSTLDDVVSAYAVGGLAEVRGRHHVWRGSSGVAELGTSRPVPARGTFRAGSISKTFVATVVLQLAGEGRLGLDDPVERWLPGVVPGGDRITIRQLLDHTSGLYDYLNTLPFPPSPQFLHNRWRTWTAAEQIRRALRHPPNFEPGTAYSYSNTNYLLLGEVIKKVTGRSYGREIERRIIRPLHLRGTEMPRTSPRIPGPHPHGYVPTQEGDDPHLIDFTRMNPSVMGAGGELISTAKDLNHFFAALLRGRLLPDRLLEEMKTPGVPGATYGMGLAWRDTSCGVRAYGNDGDALAYQAWSYSTQDLRRQVTIALTPDFRGDTDDAVDAFLDDALCS